MSSSFPRSTGKGRHFDQPGVWFPKCSCWRSMALWWWVLTHRGYGVTRRAGKLDPGVNTDTGMFGWVGEVFDPCSQDLHWSFKADQGIEPHFREVGSKHLASSRCRLVAPNHKHLNWALGHQFSSWSCISLMSAYRVAPFQGSEHYSAHRYMD